MTDFAQMGTVLGAQAAIAQVVSDGEQTIAEKNATIAEYRSALVIEQVTRLALDAQVDALLAELRRVAPNSPLLQKTGRTFADGRAESKIARVYVDSFDKFAKAKGIRDPEKLREKVR